jgi:hypothetical protein
MLQEFRQQVSSTDTAAAWATDAEMEAAAGYA